MEGTPMRKPFPPLFGIWIIMVGSCSSVFAQSGSGVGVSLGAGVSIPGFSNQYQLELSLSPAVPTVPVVPIFPHCKLSVSLRCEDCQQRAPQKRRVLNFSISRGRVSQHVSCRKIPTRFSALFLQTFCSQIGTFMPGLRWPNTVNGAVAVRNLRA